MHEDINMLIQTHSGLVYNQLHRFKLIQDQEAESIAYEALYNAILNFDSSKGNKLSTVATVYIYNALGSYVRSLNKQRQLQVVSYHNIADDNGNEYVNILSTSIDIEQEYIKNELYKIVIEVFSIQYDKLTNEKHKAIIGLWRDSEFSAQTKDIAKQISVSQSYVSQVINNFKYTLKKKLEDVYYD